MRRPHIFMLGCGGCDVCALRLASFVLPDALLRAAIVAQTWLRSAWARIKLFFLAFGFVLTGCASPLQGAADALDAVAIVAKTAQPTLDGQYEADQRACLVEYSAAEAASACVAKVRSSWRPVRDAYRATRTTWLGADAALRTAQALEALGKAPQTAQVLELVAGALAALDRFRAAVEQLQHPTAAAEPKGGS